VDGEEEGSILGEEDVPWNLQAEGEKTNLIAVAGGRSSSLGREGEVGERIEASGKRGPVATKREKKEGNFLISKKNERS